MPSQYPVPLFGVQTSSSALQPSDQDGDGDENRHHRRDTYLNGGSRCPCRARFTHDGANGRAQYVAGMANLNGS